MTALELLQSASMRSYSLLNFVCLLLSRTSLFATAIISLIHPRRCLSCSRLSTFRGEASGNPAPTPKLESNACRFVLSRLPATLGAVLLGWWCFDLQEEEQYDPLP